MEIEKWEKEVELLKSIIAKTELVETTKWGGSVYVYNNKNVIGVGGHKNFFSIWFYNGVILKDEKNYLINANEGVTKSLRQWRFTSKDQINEKEILSYILEAIENEKQGKTIKIEKAKTPPVAPMELQKELDTDPLLKEAFYKFSPYKQKEYIEFIETAKREETKLARIEKIKPMILSQIGLNDKYR